MGAYANWLPTQGVPDTPNDGGWLRGTQGQALSRALGTEADLQQFLLLQGLLARFPTKGNADSDGKYGLAPADALDQTGADRLLRRGPAESDAAYAPRLQAAWDAWEFAGSHWGVLRALQLAGYADMLIVQDNGRYCYLTGSTGDIATDLAFGTLMTCLNRPGDANGWMFDGRVDFYSRFAIVFTADAANLADPSGQKILVDIVNQWKPSKDQFVAAYVILAGQLMGWPTGRTLGTEPNLGGNSVRVIPGDGSAPVVIGP